MACLHSVALRVGFFIDPNGCEGLGKAMVSELRLKMSSIIQDRAWVVYLKGQLGGEGLRAKSFP